jgi:predicted nuclease with TOPRIM domain
MNNILVFLCIACAYVAFYYFNRNQELERDYNKLHDQHTKTFLSMNKMKSRVRDLQAYKDDVSKTFKILDRELVNINEHIKQQDNQPSHIDQNRFNNVSLMTPEILNMLFTNMNQETQSSDPPDTVNLSSINVSYTPNLAEPSDNYDQFTIQEEAVDKVI